MKATIMIEFDNGTANNLKEIINTLHDVAHTATKCAGPEDRLRVTFEVVAPDPKPAPVLQTPLTRRIPADDLSYAPTPLDV